MALCAVLFSAGCYTFSSVPFTPVEPENQALIYFYRSKAFFCGAFSVRIDKGNRLVGHLKQGAYLWYRTEPGDDYYTFRCGNAEGNLRIRATAGEPVYVNIEGGGIRITGRGDQVPEGLANSKYDP
jgi:hypothetical protein